MKYVRLKKKAGARIFDQTTVKIEDCREVTGLRSMKSADESPEFVHVLESFIPEHGPDKVVVKIMDNVENRATVERELYALEEMKDFANSVKMLCHFGCLDDKNRWMDPVRGPVKMCNNKKDDLYFIVLEYLDGDLEDFFAAASFEQVAAFFIQVVLALLEMGFEYRINHGDIHSGNVLIRYTDQEYAFYSIKGVRFKTKTQGIIPVFLDYGRSSRIYPTNEFVVENALIAVECFKKYVKDDALGAFFNEVLIKCHDWRKLVDGVVRFFNEGRSTIKM